MTQTTTPPPISINDLAALWKEFFKSIDVSVSSDIRKYVEGTYSAYLVQFMLRGPARELQQYFYVGLTADDPKTRLSTHLSELRSCKTTTNVGKSKLYTPEIMGGVTAIDMIFTVVESGLEKSVATGRERELSAQFRQLFGDDAVLTKPR